MIRYSVRRRGRLGFTLIELMIVVAIIGILSLIALPKFADMVRKAKEGATKGRLGAVRSALMIYYGDAPGFFPNDPSVLTAGASYLDAFTAAETPNYHPKSAAVVLGSGAAALTDAGGWGYVNDATSQWYGTIVVNCTHTDSKGSIWTDY
ncbi:MAG: type II secretion system protein [Elusimicrobiota bacterium]